MRDTSDRSDRWQPRHAVTEPEGGGDALDEELLPLPEPPPPGMDDDIRVPNPDRWSGDSRLPVWFFIVAGVMILFGTLSIVWNEPVYTPPEIPDDFGEQ